MASSWQLLFAVIAGNLGSGCGACVRSSFCLAAGGNNRAGVILIVGGTVLAVVVSVIAW